MKKKYYTSPDFEAVACLPDRLLDDSLTGSLDTPDLTEENLEWL